MLNFTHMCSREDDKSRLDKILKENQIKEVIIFDSSSSSDSNPCDCSNESSTLSNFDDCECIFEDTDSKSAFLEDHLKKEEKQDVEFTLAVLKPEIVMFRTDIERQIRNEGFQILQSKCLQLTPEQASEFYEGKSNDANFACIIKQITSDPIIVMVLAKHDAIEDWKKIIGPEDITEARSYFPDGLKTKYGIDNIRNGIHGSASYADAEREINYFFPHILIEPISVPRRGELFLWNHINPMLSKGIIKVMSHRSTISYLIQSQFENISDQHISFT